jgi:ABC-type Co2+ transport system permease subunit
MHIEPGLVAEAKMWLGHATATGTLLYSAALGRASLRSEGVASIAVRSGMSMVSVLVFFQVLPHYPVGVSEVHLIFGSTIFLLLGAFPASVGLAVGLLVQGLIFAPLDLPQFGMNLTTLLLPLFVLSAVAAWVLPTRTAYVDLHYRDVLALSLTYQAGVVALVIFWVFWGQGLSASTYGPVLQFGGAYIPVVLLEPVVDLALLAGAKALRGTALEVQRLFKVN